MFVTAIPLAYQSFFHLLIHYNNIHFFKYYYPFSIRNRNNGIYIMFELCVWVYFLTGPPVTDASQRIHYTIRTHTHTVLPDDNILGIYYLVSYSLQQAIVSTEARFFFFCHHLFSARWLSYQNRKFTRSLGATHRYSGEMFGAGAVTLVANITFFGEHYTSIRHTRKHTCYGILRFLLSHTRTKHGVAVWPKSWNRVRPEYGCT